MSILPKYAVALPLGSIAIHESSSSGVSGGLPVAAVWLNADSIEPGRAMLTTSAPVVIRNSRRVISFMMFTSRIHQLGGALHRAHDRHMRAASTFAPVIA